MALKDIVKVNRKTFVDPRSWLGYDALKEQSIGLWGFIKNLFVPAKAARVETFEQAMERLHISQDDLKNSEESYRAFAWVFAILTGLMGVFGFYALLHHGSLPSLILSFAVAALFAAQAFRFSFWAFQIKVRQLGCTFEEWRQGRLIHRNRKGPTP